MAEKDSVSERLFSIFRYLGGYEEENLNRYWPRTDERILTYMEKMELVESYGEVLVDCRRCYKLTKKGKKMYLEYLEETKNLAVPNRD